MKQDKDKGKQLIRNSTAEFLIFTGQTSTLNWFSNCSVSYFIFIAAISW